MEKVKDKVRVSYRNEAICLSGSRVNVTHCKTVVEGAVSAVVFDSLNVYKSGVKKLFQENEVRRNHKMNPAAFNPSKELREDLIDATEELIDLWLETPVPTGSVTVLSEGSEEPLQPAVSAGGGPRSRSSHHRHLQLPLRGPRNSFSLLLSLGGPKSPSSHHHLRLPRRHLQLHHLRLLSRRLLCLHPHLAQPLHLHPRLAQPLRLLPRLQRQRLLPRLQPVEKIKRKDSIKNEEARVHRFSVLDSFRRSFYGKASLKLPDDSAILRYLAQNKSAADTIFSEMEKHFCIVNLGQTTVTLSPVDSLLKQKDAKAIKKEWTDTVKSAFEQSLSQFKSVKFYPVSDAWEESEKKIREMLLNENVIVVPDKDRGALSVAGPVSDVNRLEKSLSEIINKIHREKSSKTVKIEVSPSVFHLLCQNGLMDELLLVYPELKMSPESPNLKITGLGEEINAASKVIFDGVFALKRQNLELDKNVLELLKDEQQEELTDALLTSHQINAAFKISGNRVQLLAVSDRDLSHAQDHLGQLLTSQYIHVEDSNVLKKPEWQQLVSHLEQANSKPCRTRINTTAQQVVVSGYKDSVIKVQHQLGVFLTQNAHIEETVVVKANAVVEYLKDFNTSWMEKVKDKVRVSYRNEAICLSGSRVNVTHCKTVVEGAVSAVVFDSLNVCVSGVKKLFQENEALYVSSIKTKTGCLVQLVDKTGSGQDNAVQDMVASFTQEFGNHGVTHSQQAPPPKAQPSVFQPTGSDLYLYHVQTNEGLDIVLKKGNIEFSMTEVIVTSVPPDFNLNRGAVSKAILRAAGPKLQQLINAQGATGNVGQGNVNARLVADAMLDAVIDMLSQNASSPLTKIRIVIFRKAMLKDFHSSMEQRAATDPNPKDKGQGTWGGTGIGKVQGSFTGGNTEKPNKENCTTEGQKADATCFHICGATQADVDLAKKLLFQEPETATIEDEVIGKFCDADHQKLDDMKKTMGISIKIENSKVKLTIEGLSSDVLKANSEINMMLSRKRDAIPEQWERMPANTTCQAFAVQAKTSEYDEILNLFQASCSGIVTKIERIQNPVLWKSLQLKKREMELRNGHQDNERRLFHGTRDTVVPKINDRGFNRSYAGMNDQRNVLAKESHQISLEKGVLKLTVRLPTEEKSSQEHEKLEKYQGLREELERMWRVKVTVVPVVIGALGAVTPKLGEWLQQIPGTTSEISVQKSAVLGTAKILRRTLKLPGLW
ncbi:unnamed protein product [Oreochromis niloticus]|nr:unnamed protein product [Mustela putorius furo]